MTLRELNRIMDVDENLVRSKKFMKSKRENKDQVRDMHCSIPSGATRLLDWNENIREVF